MSCRNVSGTSAVGSSSEGELSEGENSSEGRPADDFLESSAGLLDLCGGLVTIVLKGRMCLGLESPYPGRGMFRQLQCPVSF